VTKHDKTTFDRAKLSQSLHNNLPLVNPNKEDMEFEERN